MTQPRNSSAARPTKLCSRAQEETLLVRPRMQVNAADTFVLIVVHKFGLSEEVSPRPRALSTPKDDKSSEFIDESPSAPPQPWQQTNVGQRCASQACIRLSRATTCCKVCRHLCTRRLVCATNAPLLSEINVRRAELRRHDGGCPAVTPVPASLTGIATLRPCEA